MRNVGITHSITLAMSKNQYRLARTRFFEVPYSKSCLKLPVPLTMNFSCPLERSREILFDVLIERFLKRVASRIALS